VLKSPLSTLKKNAAEFKNLRLAYIFADQRAEVVDGKNAVRGIRVLSMDRSPIAHDEFFDPSAGTPGYTFAVANMAGYKLALTSPPVRTGTTANPFMAEHAALLDEALSGITESRPPRCRRSRSTARRIGARCARRASSRNSKRSCATSIASRSCGRTRTSPTTCSR
jgi:hypothetical protein